MKQIKVRKIFAYIIMVFLIVAVFIQPASAATAPGITFIVNFPPDDLKLSIRFADGYIEESKGNQTAWESQYWFALYNGHSYDGAKLLVQSKAKNFECDVSASSDVYTLNLSSESLTKGLSPFRSVVLVLMHVFLALLLKGLILFAFRYKEKASWIVFLITSLITQGGVYILLTTLFTMNFSGWFIGLIVSGLIIIPAESIVFSLKLKEHRKRRAVLYALTANIASLILGVVLLSQLPV